MKQCIYCLKKHYDSEFILNGRKTLICCKCRKDSGSNRKDIGERLDRYYDEEIGEYFKDKEEEKCSLCQII